MKNLVIDCINNNMFEEAYFLVKERNSDISYKKVLSEVLQVTNEFNSLTLRESEDLKQKIKHIATTVINKVTRLSNMSKQEIGEYFKKYTGTLLSFLMLSSHEQKEVNDLNEAIANKIYDKIIKGESLDDNEIEEIKKLKAIIDKKLEKKNNKWYKFFSFWTMELVTAGLSIFYLFPQMEHLLDRLGIKYMLNAETYNPLNGYIAIILVGLIYYKFDELATKFFSKK